MIKMRGFAMPLVLFVFLLLRLTDPFIDRGVGKLSGVEIWLEPCDHLGREQVGQVGTWSPKGFGRCTKIESACLWKGGLGGGFLPNRWDVYGLKLNNGPGPRKASCKDQQFSPESRSFLYPFLRMVFAFFLWSTGTLFLS